jgi:ribulose-phosphate 3-epimerase
VKISASLYSSSLQDLPSLVHELDALQLDFFHLDCFEGQEQKVSRDIRAIQQISNTPIDLHVIGANYSSFFDMAQDLGVSQLTLQYENLPEHISLTADRLYNLGLAIVNDTSLEVLDKVKDSIDYVLLMTTTPGKSGGKFEKTSFDRIRKCKQMYPNLPIYVDGGINAEVSFILRLLGVRQAVSGSFLVNHQNIAKALADLRFHQQGSAYQIKDFLLEARHLPVLNPSTCTVKDVILTMDECKLGFVLFEEGGSFVGICSNADLRKGILKYLDSPNDMKVRDMINYHPIVIQDESTTDEMLSLVKSYDFPILFLPVVGQDGVLKGAVLFNELIKGEG